MSTLVPSETTLALLAGGLGKRMGTPKALLQIDGRPILEWILAELTWPGPTMLVTAPAVADPPGAKQFGSRVIDPENGLGPLRGVLTALENLSTAAVVVIPVDMPNIRQAQLIWLLQKLDESPQILGVMCRRGAKHAIEPLHCVFRAAAKGVISARLTAGLLSVQDLCAEPGFAAVDAPESWPAEVWMNLNDQDSMQKFQASRVIRGV
jgi:molybdenum cofactor guanylyltransferase